MAYVNVASWNTDQVAEWIKGLSDHEAMQSYARQLQTSDVTGAKLLRLRAGDLRQLNISRVGHQEIILAAISRLQTLHYTLNSENLQQLAMRLCSKARSLYSQLSNAPPSVTSDSQSQTSVTSSGQSNPPKQRVTVAILEAVTDLMTSVKDIISWLNTAPFEGQKLFTDIKARILEPSIELVINAQRDSFAVRPVDGIRDASKQLADVCDDVIQNCPDSLILLPAPLLIMTIKRKPDEPLGLHIVRAISGVHIITGVKFQSPAHICGKLEEGDEIVQVNYQTVVGWQLGKVIDLLQDKEFGAEVYLTVKKRPKHSNLIDQVYFKPFRLPNKKRTPYRWNTSPRPDLLTSLPRIPLPPRLPSPEAPTVELTPQQSSDSDSDAFLAETGADAASPTSVRHYQPKPRLTLQRRATVTGASPTSRRPPASLEQFWKELTQERRVRAGLSGADSPPLRRHTLSSDSDDDLPTPPPRPLTCIPGGGGGGDSPQPLKLTVLAAPPLRRAVVTSETTSPASDVDTAAGPISNGVDAGVGADFGEKAGGDVEDEGGGGAARPSRSSVSSLPEPASALEKPRLEKTQSAPAYDPGRRDESFERVLRQLPRSSAIQEESDSEPEGESAAGFAATTNHPATPASATGAPAAPPAASLSVTAAGASGHPAPPSTARPPPAAPAQEEGLCEAPAAAPCTDPAHSTTLHVEGVTQDDSSTDMPCPPKDAKDASALREIIEAMDVAFRGLKTSLSDLSRAETPSSPPTASGDPGRSGTMLRHHPRLSFKGRRVSCKDLGQGDCQGWLYLKKEGRGFLHHDKWSKRWLVLHEHVLYSYRSKEAQEAETLISLPGYQVSPASDVRSKKHAFRVHNADRSLVFASDSQLDMTKWMNKMGLSAIAYASPQSYTTGGFGRPEPDLASLENVHFSDTDEEEDQRRTPLRTPASRAARPAVSPSPTSSLDRARQKLRSWRAASPAPSVGSVSSLSSLGSERPQVRKKPSLRFLARVRKDSGAATPSEGGQGGERATTQPETPRRPDVVSAQPTSPGSEARGSGASFTSSSSPRTSGLSDVSEKMTSTPGDVSEQERQAVSRQEQESGVSKEQEQLGTVVETVDRETTPTPQRQQAPASAAAGGAAQRPVARPGPVTAAPVSAARSPARPVSSGVVSVTARWLDSPDQVVNHGPRRPLSQPTGGGRQRPVPPPRRPRSRDAGPEYVNWRVPPPASALPPALQGRQTETVIRIGGGRVERIEERERRPQSLPQREPRVPPAVTESRRLSVQHHRGVTSEGRAVANILSGTHTVPYRRAASADPDRLPGYMRPTIAASRRQQDAAEARREAAVPLPSLSRREPVVPVPSLSKQRSVSTSRLSPLPPPNGGRPRRSSLTPGGAERRLSVDGGSLPRKPAVPSRPRLIVDSRGVRARPRALSEEPAPVGAPPVVRGDGELALRRDGGDASQRSIVNDAGRSEEEAKRGSGADTPAGDFDKEDDSVFVTDSELRPTSSNDTITEETQTSSLSPATTTDELSSSVEVVLPPLSVDSPEDDGRVFPETGITSSPAQLASVSALKPKPLDRKQRDTNSDITAQPPRTAVGHPVPMPEGVPRCTSPPEAGPTRPEPLTRTSRYQSPSTRRLSTGLEGSPQSRNSWQSETSPQLRNAAHANGSPQLRNASQTGAGGSSLNASGTGDSLPVRSSPLSSASHQSRASDSETSGSSPRLRNIPETGGSPQSYSAPRTGGSPQLRSVAPTSVSAQYHISRPLLHSSPDRGLYRMGSPASDPLRPPLKKTSQYECPSWSPMARHAEDARWRLAFEMSLDGGERTGAAERGSGRPRLPPRLSKSASASQVGPVQTAGSGRVRPSISIQVPPDGTAADGEPRTPLKPAMGVSMIGKQRRTPTATSSSPHFVFPSPAGPTSPPPLSSGYGSLSASQHTLSEADAALTAVGGPSPSPTPAPLSKSATSPQLGWAFRVLPGYGLQYPPTFTPDTYSLARLSQSQHTPPQGAVTSQQHARAEEAGQTPPPPPPRTVSDCSTQTVAPPGGGSGRSEIQLTTARRPLQLREHDPSGRPSRAEDTAGVLPRGDNGAKGRPQTGESSPAGGKSMGGLLGRIRGPSGDSQMGQLQAVVAPSTSEIMICEPPARDNGAGKIGVAVESPARDSPVGTVVSKLGVLEGRVPPEPGEVSGPTEAAGAVVSKPDVLEGRVPPEPGEVSGPTKTAGAVVFKPDELEERVPTEAGEVPELTKESASTESPVTRPTPFTSGHINANELVADGASVVIEPPEDGAGVGGLVDVSVASGIGQSSEQSSTGVIAAAPGWRHFSEPAGDVDIGVIAEAARGTAPDGATGIDVVEVCRAQFAGEPAPETVPDIATGGVIDVASAAEAGVVPARRVDAAPAAGGPGPAVAATDGERTLRRKNTLKGRRRRGSEVTERGLRLLALQRAVKAKQAEVEAISRLLRTPVTRPRLRLWMSQHPGLLPAAADGGDEPDGDSSSSEDG